MSTAILKELQEIVRDLGKSQKKTEESHRKTEESHRELAKSQKKTEESHRELAKSHKKTEETLRELAKTQKESQERMEKSSKEADKRLKKLDELFNGQWGKLMEALVKGDLIKLLKERNIHVTGIAKEHERLFSGKQYEFDIIAINGDEIVVVEVKTTLKKKDVDHFTNKLKDFKNIFHEYTDKKVLGAVAYLKEHTGSVQYSIRQGLFVIRATGSSSSIINEKGFHPKVF